jgi:hypothetical protein
VRSLTTTLLATMCLAVSAAVLPAAALAAAPVIEQASASGVTADDATLEAQINPEGNETEYEIVLVDPCAGPSECVLDVRLAGATIASSVEHESVKVELASAKEPLNIEPGTTYEYWVVARSSDGTDEVHKFFKTLNGGPPSIDGESVSDVTEHDATLEAQIDSNGLHAGYEFQIDTNSSYNFTQAACPFAFPGAQCELIFEGEPLPAGLVEPVPEYIPAASGGRSVSLDLASTGSILQPAATYHYRVIASNGSESVQGADQTFTTLPTPSPPSTSVPPGTTSAPIAVVVGPSAAPGATPFDSAVKTTSKPKPMTSQQRLAKALRACGKKPKRQRAGCKRRAHRKYATSAIKIADKHGG